MVLVMVAGYTRNMTLPFATLIGGEDSGTEVCDFTTSPDRDWQADIQNFIIPNPSTRAASSDGVRTFCFDPGTYNGKISLDGISNVRFLGKGTPRKEVIITLTASPIQSLAACLDNTTNEKVVSIKNSQNIIFRKMTLTLQRSVDYDPNRGGGPCSRFDTTVYMGDSSDIAFKQTAIKSLIQYPLTGFPHKVSRAITVFESTGVRIFKNRIDATGKQAIAISRKSPDASGILGVELKDSVVRCYYFCIDANYRYDIVAAKTNFINEYMHDAPSDKRGLDTHANIWLSGGAQMTCDNCSFKFLSGAGIAGGGYSHDENRPSVLTLNNASISVAKGLPKVLMLTHPNYLNNRLYITGNAFNKFERYRCIGWRNFLCRDNATDRGGTPSNNIIFMRKRAYEEFRQIDLPNPLATRIISRTDKCLTLEPDNVRVSGRECTGGARVTQQWIVVGTNRMYRFVIKLNSPRQNNCLTMPQSNSGDSAVRVQECVSGDPLQEFKIMDFYGTRYSACAYSELCIGELAQGIIEDIQRQAPIEKCLEVRLDGNVVLDPCHNEKDGAGKIIKITTQNRQKWRFDAEGFTGSGQERSVASAQEEGYSTD